jgi:hypothetical protein
VAEDPRWVFARLFTYASHVRRRSFTSWLRPRLSTATSATEPARTEPRSHCPRQRFIERLLVKLSPVAHAHHYLIGRSLARLPQSRCAPEPPTLGSGALGFGLGEPRPAWFPDVPVRTDDRLRISAGRDDLHDLHAVDDDRRFGWHLNTPPSQLSLSVLQAVEELNRGP